MRRLLIRLLAVMTSVGLCVPQANGPSVERLMTPVEFREAGLTKLSSNELAALNRWLGRYTVLIVKTLSQSSDPRPGATPDAIESYIAGDFEGWDGETIFKLDNGQIWQQASYAYTYHYAYHPSILIYRTAGGFRMKVDGVTDTILVKRLK